MCLAQLQTSVSLTVSSKTWYQPSIDWTLSHRLSSERVSPRSAEPRLQSLCLVSCSGWRGYLAMLMFWVCGVQSWEFYPSELCRPRSAAQSWLHVSVLAPALGPALPRPPLPPPAQCTALSTAAWISLSLSLWLEPVILEQERREQGTGASGGDIRGLSPGHYLVPGAGGSHSSGEEREREWGNFHWLLPQNF